MSLNTTVPFDGTLTKNVNDELSVAAAFDVPVGAHLQISGQSSIPHTAGGMNTHPANDFFVLSFWGIGLNGDFTVETSWAEDQMVTQEMLDTFINILSQANIGSGVVFEISDVDFIERTVDFTCSIPAEPELGWRGSPLPWMTSIQNQKIIWDANSHYLCATILDSDWTNWATEKRDIAPNSSLVIDRVEGASTVYLIFSEDVTTSTGVTLNRGVAYSQTSESMEVTAGNADTLVIRVSR
jgi:hypothetical protein